MFPLTHLYAAKLITKKRSPLLLYGSVFPDIPVTGVVGWDEFQSNTTKFADFIGQSYPNLDTFVEGILAHEETYGIDRFGHGKNKDGYAYQTGKKILPEVTNMLLGSNSQIVSLILERKLVSAGHNIVEFAFEYLMVQKHSKLQDDMLYVLQHTSQYQHDIAKATSDFFKLDLKATQKKLKTYNSLLAYDISSFDNAVSELAKLIKMQRKIGVDEKKVAFVLKKAIRIVKDEYEEKLAEFIAICRKDYLSFRIKQGAN